MTSRLMLLDTASLYFRAFFGVPSSLRAPDGSPVNAVRGLLDFVARLVTDHRPTHLVACEDVDWRPAFRVAALPSYKAHRVAAEPAAAGPGAMRDEAGEAEETPDELSVQVPVIWDVLAAIGIARAGAEGCEADDVIGTLTERAVNAEGDGPAHGAVDVVTGDRDLFQLIDDDRGVRVLYTARGVRACEVVDDAVVRAKYDIPARAYADFALLRGDPSDGLPGVAGIGEKTAAALLRAHGTLDGLLAAAQDPAGGVPVASRRRLAAARDYLAVAPTVVRVRRDAPVPQVDGAVPTAPADAEALAELTERWGLSGPVGRVGTALGWSKRWQATG